MRLRQSVVPLRSAILSALAAAALLSGPARAQGGAPGNKAEAPVAPPVKATPLLPASQTNPVVVGGHTVGTRATAGLTDTCTACHDVGNRRVTHSAFQRRTCTDCHAPSGNRRGKCQSKSVQAWQLTRPVQEMCTECHKDVVQRAAAFQVKHDVLTKGRCAQCHDPHGSDYPKLMRATGKALCLRCHSTRAPPGTEKRIDLSKRVVHRALEKSECQDCHDAGHGSNNPTLLKKQQPELCYDCHKRMDQGRSVHSAVRQGECLVCHDPHSSDRKGLLRVSREEVCLTCHELEPLVTGNVKHAPVEEGKCLDCHDAHNGDLPKMVVASGKALCLRCHDAKAPQGKGTPRPAARVDFSLKVVHQSVKDGNCQDCHVSGHSGDNLKLLRQPPADLCYKCHSRKDDKKYPHSAVRVGDCAVCHLPHSSNQKALLAKPSLKEVCFTCHQDDVTGRKVIHKPVAEGKCGECHSPHGADNRFILTRGEGKAVCYTCHKVMDNVKYRHAALDRYGCTGCHDPHGAGNKFLLPKAVNALCTSCHKDKPDGHHVTAMVAAGHVVSGPVDPRHPDRPFTCASCHNPHGSDSPKLFYFGDNPMESCDGCHGDRTGKHPELKNVISRARQVATGTGGGGAPGGGGSAQYDLGGGGASSPEGSGAAAPEEGGGAGIEETNPEVH